LKAFQPPSNEVYSGFGTSPRLDEDVKHDAFLIHRAPEVMLDALDPDEHLIKVPLVPGPRTAAAQVVGEALAEFLAPTPNGLMGDDNAPLGQWEFNISKAEAEYVVQPDSVAGALGGKAMPIVRVGRGRGLHAASFAGPQRAGRTRLP
jgi:hypothetical protein